MLILLSLILSVISQNNNVLSIDVQQQQVSNSHANDNLIPLEFNIVKARHCRDRQRIVMNDRSTELDEVVKLSLNCMKDASNGKNSTIYNKLLSNYQKNLMEKNGYNIKKEGHQFIIKWNIK